MKKENIWGRKNKNETKICMTCGERGSNTRPSDLQSDALPTELSPLVLTVSYYLI